jgi:hypothetical protein
LADIGDHRRNVSDAERCAHGQHEQRIEMLILAAPAAGAVGLAEHAKAALCWYRNVPE